jgi:hypothetical protein
VPASPQAPVTTAVGAQSEAPFDQDNPDGTLGEVEAGETAPEQPPQAEDADPVAFTLEDGTPVKQSEAKQGYLRQQDYSRKTEMLAQGRQVLSQVLDENVATREALAKMIVARLPQVDENLRYTDPGAWAAQRYERDETLRQVAQLRAESTVDREQLARQELQTAEANLPTALPHWSDQAVRQRETNLAKDYVAKLGVPRETIEKITRDAWLTRFVVEAAKHRPVVQGAARGGAASAASRQQLSPSISTAQVRPAPVGTAASRQQHVMRGGEAARTQPGPTAGLRSRLDAGVSRLKPMVAQAR